MTAVRGPRGPYAQGVLRREEIVRAALETFASNGFHGTSLRAIATQVGISHVGVAYHFKSKEELLMAVLDHRDEVIVARLQQLFPSSPEKMPLEELLIAITRHNQETPLLRRLYTTLQAEACTAGHPASGYFAERCARNREQLANFPEVQRAAAALRMPALLVAGTLLAVLDGLQTQWLLDPDFDELGALRGHLALLVGQPTRRSRRASG